MGLIDIDDRHFLEDPIAGGRVYKRYEIVDLGVIFVDGGDGVFYCCGVGGVD